MRLFDTDENGMAGENNVTSKAFDQLYISNCVVGGQLKRVFDIVFASTILLLILPLFIIVAVVLKVAEPGPVFYRHARIGLWGRKFACFKFRTMGVDAENAMKALLDDDPIARVEWERNQKLVKDPRVTRVGRFLRGNEP